MGLDNRDPRPGEIARVGGHRRQPVLNKICFKYEYIYYISRIFQNFCEKTWRVIANDYNDYNFNNDKACEPQTRSICETRPCQTKG